MSNLGRYQDIVEEAYQAGGPDTWLNIIKNAAYKDGASDMKNKLVLPLLVTGVGTGIGLGVIGKIAWEKITKWIADQKDKKLLTEKEAKEAEKFLKKELSKAIDEIERENGGEKHAEVS